MLAACMLAAAPMAQAAPRDPVLDLLGAVTANYRPGSRGHEDYFGDTRLDSIYSRAFAASFRAAIAAGPLPASTSSCAPI